SASVVVPGPFDRRALVESATPSGPNEELPWASSRSQQLRQPPSLQKRCITTSATGRSLDCFHPTPTSFASTTSSSVTSATSRFNSPPEAERRWSAWYSPNGSVEST